VGVITIITKIHRWDESAMFFDGGSLGKWALHPLIPVNPLKLIRVYTQTLRSAQRV
jgi:hypothetical protein